MFALKFVAHLLLLLFWVGKYRMTTKEDYLQAQFKKLPNLYSFMGIKPDADKLAIKKAYKLLGRLYHPDKNDALDAADKFGTLKQAYDILLSQKLRVDYDRYLQGHVEIEQGKAQMSERRKKFAEDLKRREEMHKKSKNTHFSNEDKHDLSSHLRKKRSKNVETLFDSFSQSKLNEYITAEREDKDKLKKLLCTVSITWTIDSQKTFNKILLRLIFRRFGEITSITMNDLERKAYIEFSDMHAPTLSVAAFKKPTEKEDLKVKFLISEDRERHISKYKETGQDRLNLSSQNIDRIVGAYNGYTYETRKEQMQKDVQRQRLIEEMLNKEKQIVLDNK